MAEDETPVEAEDAPAGKTNDDQPAHGSAVTEPVDTQFPGGNPNNRQEAPADADEAGDGEESDSRDR